MCFAYSITSRIAKEADGKSADGTLLMGWAVARLHVWEMLKWTEGQLVLLVLYSRTLLE